MVGLSLQQRAQPESSAHLEDHRDQVFPRLVNSRTPGTAWRTHNGQTGREDREELLV